MINGLRFSAETITCARPWTFDDCQTADLRLIPDFSIVAFCLLQVLNVLVLLCISSPITYTMAPVKCYYHNCNSTNANKSMFTFPINDEPRLKLWITHSGNANLASLTHKELKQRFICEDHFKAKDLRKCSARSRLVRKAVPIKYEPVTSPCPDTSPDHMKVKTPQKVYKRKLIDLPMQEDPSPSTSMIDAPLQTKGAVKRRRLFQDTEDQLEVKRLNKLVAQLQKKNKNQQSKIRRLSLKGGSKKKRIMILESLPFASEASKTMASMQLRSSKSRTRWTRKEKELCISIYYKSPSTYIHMRRQGIVLAAPSTIRKWLGQTNCLPGLQKDVFQNVEQCFKHATIQERSCVLAFDEMSIMASLEYSKTYDQIEGFQDFGRGERAPMVAKYVLVFLIRGLYSGWKLPIAYFLSAGNVAASKLTFLIKIVINKLFEIGLLPKAIVSDQISTNQKALKSLGVSPDSPYFYCKERKIFAFFDVPHALKNVRNNFLSSDLTDGNKIFSFRDVITTYEIDKKNKSKCLHKLTPAHLKPNNFQKMKVSLAAQLLSRSVAVAIRTVVGTGELKSPTALDTANFIETINNAFDALNSKKSKSKNPFKRALTKSNRAWQALIEGKILLSKLKKILKKKTGSIIITRPPSFDGFLQSIEAVLQMFEEEASDGVKYLMTSRFNQDCLENLFSIFRLKAGFNKNPSARVMRTIFRSKLVNALMKTSEAKNCLEDEDVFIENTIFDVPTDPREENEIDKGDGISSEMPSTSKQHTELLQQQRETTHERTKTLKLTLEECSVVYFAGYLAKKCIDTFQCGTCKNTLIKTNSELTDTNQLLIINKMYPSAYAPKLLAPTADLVHLVNEALAIFQEYFEQMKHNRCLKQKMYECINKGIEKKNICEDHEKYIINHLLLVKINNYCKLHKKNVLENKMNTKLRILKNM